MMGVGPTDGTQAPDPGAAWRAKRGHVPCLGGSLAPEKVGQPASADAPELREYFLKDKSLKQEPCTMLTTFIFNLSYSTIDLSCDDDDEALLLLFSNFFFIFRNGQTHGHNKFVIQFLR